MFVLFIMSFVFFLKLCFVHAHTFLLTYFLIGKQIFSISPVRVSTYIYYIACKLKPIKKEFALRKPFILTHMYGYEYVSFPRFYATRVFSTYFRTFNVYSALFIVHKQP